MVDTILRLYQQGRLSKEAVKKSVQKRILTKEQYDKLIKIAKIK